MFPPRKCFDDFPPDWVDALEVLHVFFPFILDVKFVGRTARRGHTGGRSHKIYHSFLLRCMPLFFSGEGFSRSYPSSAVKSNFVY